MAAKPDSPPWWRAPLNDIIAGTLGGAAGKVVEFPFDTVKVRVQTAPQYPTLKNIASMTPGQILRRILAEEGIRGLYRGFSLPLVGTIAETATLFSTNGYLKRLLMQSGEIPAGAELPMRYVLLAGAGTGLAVSFVLTPIELVKCRMQVQGMQPAAMRRYTSTLDCLFRSIREEGISVLYRGHVATMIRETPGTACWFGAYETFIRLMMAPGVRRNDLPASTIVGAGSLGGMAYWAVMYPSDTVKSVMQTAVNDIPATAGGGPRHVRPLPTFASTFTSIHKSGGLRGLYAGVTPTMLRAAPSNAVIFLVYEYAARMLAPPDEDPR